MSKQQFSISKFVEQRFTQKQKILIQNIITIGFIFVIAYSALSISYLGDPMKFLKSNDFINVTVALIALGFVWKIFRGEQQNRTTKPTRKTQTTRKQSNPNRCGTWVCPICGTNVLMKDTCPNCGYHE